MWPYLLLVQVWILEYIFKNRIRKTLNLMWLQLEFCSLPNKDFTFPAQLSLTYQSLYPPNKVLTHLAEIPSLCLPLSYSDANSEAEVFLLSPQQFRTSFTLHGKIFNIFI